MPCELSPMKKITIEISNPVFQENKKNVTNLPSAEMAQSVVNVKSVMDFCTVAFVDFDINFIKIG